MPAALLCLLATPALVVASREQEQVTPIQKVIGMLNDMLGKAKKEKEDEQVDFAAYKQFCDSTSKEKTRSIGKGTEKVEELKADIGQADADAMVLAKDISGLDADVSAWEMENKE